MSDDTLTTADLLCGAPRSGNRTYSCALAPSHDGEHRNVNDESWFNYGPLQSYEIHWMSGHVETVVAHQVSYPHAGMLLTQTFMPGLAADGGAPRVQLHAEIDGRWRLMLSAREEDIRTMRNVTGGERL